jgi:NIMA (never in mitosis gene a)-related kinase
MRVLAPRSNARAPLAIPDGDASARVSSAPKAAKPPKVVAPRSSVTKMADFDVVRKLGEGSFGVVWAVTRRRDRGDSRRRTFCLKQIAMGPRRASQEEAINECRVLAKLDSPHVVKYHESFVADGGTKLCIVMEYAPRGTVRELIKTHRSSPRGRVPEPVAWRLLLQCCLGLSHIHSRHILHRDVKSENIFLDKNGDAKIGDLGVAKMIGAESAGFAKTLVGTPFYLSPELCRGKPYNHKSDAWALGCVLYECMEARHPFTANSREGLFAKIAAGKYPAPSGPHGLGMRKIVTRLLSTSAERRFGADDVLRADEAVAAAKTVGVELEGRRAANDDRGEGGAREGREVGGGFQKPPTRRPESAGAPETLARKNPPGFCAPESARARARRAPPEIVHRRIVRDADANRPDDALGPGVDALGPGVSAHRRRPTSGAVAAGVEAAATGRRPEELRRAFLAARRGRAEAAPANAVKGAEPEPTEPTDPTEPAGFPPSKPPPSSNPSPPPRLVSASAARRSEAIAAAAHRQREQRERTRRAARAAEEARANLAGARRALAREAHARAHAPVPSSAASPVDSPPASVDVRSKAVRSALGSPTAAAAAAARVPSRSSTAAGRVAALRAAGRAPSARRPSPTVTHADESERPALEKLVRDLPANVVPAEAGEASAGAAPREARDASCSAVSRNAGGYYAFGDAAAADVEAAARRVRAMRAIREEARERCAAAAREAEAKRAALARRPATAAAAARPLSAAAREKAPPRPPRAPARGFVHPPPADALGQHGVRDLGLDRRPASAAPARGLDRLWTDEGPASKGPRRVLERPTSARVLERPTSAAATRRREETARAVAEVAGLPDDVKEPRALEASRSVIEEEEEAAAAANEREPSPPPAEAFRRAAARAAAVAAGVLESLGGKTPGGEERLGGNPAVKEGSAAAADGEDAAAPPEETSASEEDAIRERDEPREADEENALAEALAAFDGDALDGMAARAAADAIEDALAAIALEDWEEEEETSEEVDGGEDGDAAESDDVDDDDVDDDDDDDDDDVDDSAASDSSSSSAASDSSSSSAASDSSSPSSSSPLSSSRASRVAATVAEMFEIETRAERLAGGDAFGRAYDLLAATRRGDADERRDLSPRASETGRVSPRASASPGRLLGEREVPSSALVAAGIPESAVAEIRVLARRFASRVARLERLGVGAGGADEDPEELRDEDGGREGPCGGERGEGEGEGEDGVDRFRPSRSLRDATPSAKAAGAAAGAARGAGDGDAR